jgi:3-hydroxyacyl-CoA dehydrogenase/enoyl-CoA hydratase/3-hydroxybutyryl-CoA epimerase
VSALDSMPWPENAPAAGACVRIERPEASLAVLVIDPPHRKLAVFDAPLMRDLDAAVSQLERDASVTALVITGRSPTSFVAGADIDAIEQLNDPNVAYELARFGQSLFERIARLRARKVAAVGGPVPGGAFEMSLACDRIVLADHPSSRIGLPETKLGILPGWGGCQRLPRRVGVPTALAAILAGKLYFPREALRAGLVDRLTPPEYLRRIAVEIATGRMPCARRERGLQHYLVDVNPIALAIIGRTAQRELDEKTHGHYPAPPAALKLVLNAPHTPIEVGFEREARALGALAVTDVCKNLIGIFRMSEDSKKLARLPDGGEVRAITRGGVIGAGVMGAGIAQLMAEKGLSVRLGDVARKALDSALAQHAKNIDKSLKRRFIEPYAARAAIDRLEATAELVGFHRCEIVVEAVAEKLEVKRSVMGAIAAQVSSDAILATNTSSLSVSAIAEQLPHPERVVGMHFFNPVHAMPLVEVVRGAHTNDATVAATAKLALALGKTPIVVADVAGFLVNRILGPYLNEATRLFESGVDPALIEKAAVDFGMPMGPLELLDEVGLDIAAHAAQSLEAAYGERMKSSKLVARMLERGLKGKKGGAGFFVYANDPKTGRPKRVAFNGDVTALAGPRAASSITQSEITDRLIGALIAEAELCLRDRVVSSPRDIDLATVFGIGFPPFRGGLMRYAEQSHATAAR